VNLWQVTEHAFDPKELHSKETVYSIGNGYFGTRGTFDEGYPGAAPATLIYGVFDTIPVAKEELANVPDWLLIKLFVNGERFRLDEGRILDFQRTLDVHTGVLSRTVRWESPTGIRIKVVSERFASLADPHAGAIRYSVTAEEPPKNGEEDSGELDVTIWASINTAVGNYDVMHFETVDQGHDGELIWLHMETRHTHVQLVQAMSFTTNTPDFHKEVLDSDIAPSIRLYGKLGKGQTLTTEKVVVMYTSRDGVANPRTAALNDLRAILERSHASSEPDIHYALSIGSGTETIDRTLVYPYETLLGPSKAEWERYWDVSDIIIEGDDTSQIAVRFSIFQLRISTAPDDSRYSVAAKGLTGFGYRGHIFHDTEIFILPFFTYVHPPIARNLLLYRYHLLPAARAKAAHNGYEGAQFPWESTLSGEETTPGAIVHPETGEIIPVLNGQLELHISASVAFATWNYWRVTDDNEFMLHYGAELIISTAQFWASRAEYHPAHDDYEINNVIGPDEWHEHVNNNAFTNYMARWNILTGIDTLQWLESTDPAIAEELIQQLGLTEQKLNHWRDVAAKLRIPENKETGLIEQFDGFFKLERLDQERYKNRRDSYQGLFGVRAVQKYQIIKQADVLMLIIIMRDQFSLQTKRVNWDYYYPITDHLYGSSLTPALHTILACQLGLTQQAYDLFLKGSLVDLQNLRLNTAEGIHLASCGAVWQAVVFGFAGLQLSQEDHTTHPLWPDGWTRIAFKFFHKGKLVSVDLHKGQKQGQ
jgi:trehalose/maltose hydrolase-like predicted phosphorylase